MWIVGSFLFGMAPTPETFGADGSFCRSRLMHIELVKIKIPALDVSLQTHRGHLLAASGGAKGLKSSGCLIILSR